MPDRSIATDIWADEDFQCLPTAAKLLYIYLFANSHCNQAGLYKITPLTISFETGIPLSEVEPLLQALGGMKIVWYPDRKLVWVKNFVRKQCHAPKFLIAVARCLTAVPDPQLITAYLSYNRQLSIPYQYPIDSIPIAQGKGKVLDKGLVLDVDVGDNTSVVKINKGGGKEVSLPGKSNSGEMDGQPAATRSPDGQVTEFYLSNLGEVTPLIAGYLKQACVDYTEEWVLLALQETVRAGKNGWNYTEAILHSWREKGHPSSDKRGRKKRGAERFTTGRYAHVVQH